jgi:hypothetical protein
VKVKIIKEGDGLVTVFVKRTMPKENPSRVVQHVEEGDVESVVEKLVGEMYTQPSPF